MSNSINTRGGNAATRRAWLWVNAATRRAWLWVKNTNNTHLVFTHLSQLRQHGWVGKVTCNTSVKMLGFAASIQFDVFHVICPLHAAYSTHAPSTFSAYPTLGQFCELVGHSVGWAYRRGSFKIMVLVLTRQGHLGSSGLTAGGGGNAGSIVALPPSSESEAEPSLTTTGSSSSVPDPLSSSTCEISHVSTCRHCQSHQAMLQTLIASNMIFPRCM